eukprot:gene4705-biopygen5775
MPGAEPALQRHAAAAVRCGGRERVPHRRRADADHAVRGDAAGGAAHAAHPRRPRAVDPQHARRARLRPVDVDVVAARAVGPVVDHVPPVRRPSGDFERVHVEVSIAVIVPVDVEVTVTVAVAAGSVIVAVAVAVLVDVEVTVTVAVAVGSVIAAVAVAVLVGKPRRVGKEPSAVSGEPQVRSSFSIVLQVQGLSCIPWTPWCLACVVGDNVGDVVGDTVSFRQMQSWLFVPQGYAAGAPRQGLLQSISSTTRGYPLPRDARRAERRAALPAPTPGGRCGLSGPRISRLPTHQTSPRVTIHILSTASPTPRGCSPSPSFLWEGARAKAVADSSHIARRTDPSFQHAPSLGAVHTAWPPIDLDHHRGRRAPSAPRARAHDCIMCVGDTEQLRQPSRMVADTGVRTSWRSCQPAPRLFSPRTNRFSGTNREQKGSSDKSYATPMDKLGVTLTLKQNQENETPSDPSAARNPPARTHLPAPAPPAPAPLLSTLRGPRGAPTASCELRAANPGLPRATRGYLGLPGATRGSI